MSRSVKKVLIVEDDLSLRPIWENYFKSSRDKIWIEWAVSCEQALVIIAETNRLRQYFTLIVSDVFLAGSGTGLDLMKSQPVKESRARKVLISAVDRDELMQQFGHSLPDTEIISKPLDLKKLNFIMVA